MKRFSSFLLASVLLLSGCSGIGGPQISVEEVRTLYNTEDRYLLRIAVENGNLEHVKALIKAGFRVNVKSGPFLSTPLVSAAEEGHWEIVKELIKAGADVNAKTKSFDYSYTPLHLASGRGHLEIVQQLIKAGANVKVKTKGGGTPLHSATSGKGNLEIVQELVRAGADVNVKNKSGWTPLLFAAENGKTEAVQELIKTGADVNAKTKRLKIAPLHFAAGRKKNLEIVQQLIKAGADVNERTIDNETPLDKAKSYLETVQELKLIKAGADVNPRDLDNYTPEVRNLILDAEKLYDSGEKIISLLIENGAGEYVNPIPWYTPSMIIRC